MEIKKIDDPDQKAAIVEEVLLDLPDWFGLPESTAAYIEESRQLPLWLACRADELLGFITLSESSADSCEIHCMGVKKAFHRQGIGRKLYQALETYARERYKYIQVKTVDEGHYEEYDRTVAFYQSLSFARLEVFPDLWDEWNPCLVLIKSLH